MTTAHAMRRTRSITMSEALTKAWAIAKLPKVVDQKAALQEAFKAKYPTGTLKIHQFWRGATVQFTAGGKEYTYTNFGWQQKLGLTA
ncbi:MAG: hypothetical protein FWB97_08250 [Oscillospiraceae bacterium]|nr:hypothetical protein [Oscillospiraceae bacterium]